MVELAGARWVGSSDVKGELPARPVVRYGPGGVDRAHRARVPDDGAARDP